MEPPLQRSSRSEEGGINSVCVCRVSLSLFCVTSDRVAGLFQHSRGVTLSDYCFYSVSDVYVPLGTLQPVLSRPAQAGPPSHASNFLGIF